MLEINKPIFGNCMDLLPEIPDKSIDLIFSDLPYSITKAKWDILLPLDELWLEYERIIKDNGAILLFSTGIFTSQLIISNPNLYRYDWIWEKTQGTGHLNAKKMPIKCHETINVFYKKLPTYNPQITTGHKRKVSTAKHKRNTHTGELYGKCDNFSDYDSTQRYPRSIIKFPSDKQKLNLHSTQKPLALCEYMIKTYSNEGNLVLDNCLGSGTTAVACDNLKRNWIGIEKDEDFFKLAEKRIQDNKNKIISL
jgi:site-specific DNA-methyltransferase (adenine-specific)